MSFSIRSFQNKSPQLGVNVYVDPQAAIIGDVLIGDDSSVWPMAVIRADVHAISIGKFCSIQDGAVLHVTHDGPYSPGGRSLILGNGITVGHRAVLHACTIEDYCLIGMGALVMDDVCIQKQVMVAAGSVVTPGKTLESGWLYLGNPARKVRILTEQEKQQLIYSAQHYVRLKNKYLTPYL